MNDPHAPDWHRRLVYMANQIARNFAAIGHDAAAKATADHIAQFWDPRMRAGLAGDEADLSATAARALAILRKGGDPAPQTRATQFNAVDESGGSDAG